MRGSTLPLGNVTPAQHTRVVLQEFRTLGTPFKLAWANAMRTLPRKDPDYAEWKTILRWARPAFQAEYEGGGYSVMHLDAEHTELRPCDTRQPPLLALGDLPSLDLLAS